MNRQWAWFVILPLLVSCAGYTIEADGTGAGYDVYRPMPYILVVPGETTAPNNNAANNKERPPLTAQTQTASLIWLPDYGSRYRIRTWTCFGKADFTFDIENGWKLTKIQDKSDNTAVLAELLDWAKELTKKEGDFQAGKRGFTLYKIVYDKQGHVAGLAKLSNNKAVSDHELPSVSR